MKLILIADGDEDVAESFACPVTRDNSGAPIRSSSRLNSCPSAWRTSEHSVSSRAPGLRLRLRETGHDATNRLLRAAPGTWAQSGRATSPAECGLLPGA